MGGGFSPNVSRLVINHINRLTHIKYQDLVFLGELEHGTYDDCEGLTEEEVNVFYNFHKNGELHSDDEDPDQSENEEDPLDEEYSEGYSTDIMEATVQISWT